MPPITCHILDSTIGKPASNVLCCLYKVDIIEPNETNGNLQEGELLFKDNARLIAMARTNNDGRVQNWNFNPKDNQEWLNENVGEIVFDKSSGIKWNSVKDGNYKIRFFVKEYFNRQKPGNSGDVSEINGFYSFVDINFMIKDPSQHYHIPLLLTNFGYTTYRGS
ncbi:hydroxyisourate hydrolase [Saccharomycodes ludwigii]|uniref:hydroxyisourate hydrolase n=1 Tax=Saccharomycodes ludwigii TaxID=36035 RepID=UPI001E84DCFC|nr:conserved putative 5-hydroxyisourate hydrolase [Saccharomycodes ludwigii]KAH3901861.1 conserved putative 5-hydroxyisourate hydrolase [Saccharomycodes ludwigii]